MGRTGCGQEEAPASVNSPGVDHLSRAGRPAERARCAQDLWSIDGQRARDYWHHRCLIDLAEARDCGVVRGGGHDRVQQEGSSSTSSSELLTHIGGCVSVHDTFVQVNCLTEVFIDRALRRAAELDAHLKEHGTVVGPLHGLPISLKDQFPVKGIETTMGKPSDVTY